MNQRRDNAASRTSPYKRGADDGLYFGVYLTLLFFAFVLSVKVSFFSLLAIAMFFGVPFILYRWLRRSYVADQGRTAISSLWMQGIMIFICGSILSGAIATIYLKWLDPDFIITRIHEAIDLYQNNNWEQGREMAEVLQNMVDYHLVPSAVSIVVEMIWLSIFSGSLLSLLMSILVRARKTSPTPPPYQP